MTIHDMPPGMILCPRCGNHPCSPGSWCARCNYIEMKLHGEPMLPPMDMREVDPDEMSGRSGSLFPALVNDIEPLEIELDDDDDEEGECAECDSCGASGGQVHEYYDGLCLCSDCYEETRR